MSDDYLGSGGRLSGGPSPELVRAGFAAETGHGPRLAAGMSTSDLAHAVMLAESKVIDANTARRLLAGLLELHAMDSNEFPWDPSIGDAFNSREHELKRRVGAATAGWLSAGRPRREVFRVGLRLLARAETRTLHDHVVDFAAALVDQAEAHATDLAADYTYLLPAQPVTIGYLLLAYAEPALRGAERLRNVHAHLDASVAGAGGSGGSRWPLDRERLAELLGCATVVPHAKDAAWQADVFVDLASAIAIQAAHASQLAQDFEILASTEFGVVELADGHTRASALMPQKRNPYALAVIRAAAATASGDLTAILTALHTGSARTDHFHVLNGVMPRMLAEANANAALTAAVAAGVRIDRAAAAKAAREGFVTAADVADVLAQEAGIDYRSAHKAVGLAVRTLVDAGKAPDALTTHGLADASEQAIGVRATLSPESLTLALDPEACLRTRRQTGSTAPAEVASLIAAARARIADNQIWSRRQLERESAASRALLALALELSS